MKPPPFHDIVTVDGTRVTIRTMQPDDRENERRFIKGLSAQSRYYRFHAAIKELSPTMLENFTHVNYPDEMALVAVVSDESDNGEVSEIGKKAEKLIGVTRYIRLEDPVTAEFAIVVADEWQGKGIGTRLLLDLRTCALVAGVNQLKASVLSENRRMYEFCRKLGFEVEPRHNDYSTIELGKRFEGTRFASGQ